MRIGPIVGRRNHMIKYKGTTLYPSAIFDVLDRLDYIDNYLVEVFNDDLGNDGLKVLVGGCKKEISEAEKEIKDRFRAKLRVAPLVEFFESEVIKKMQFPEINRKPTKFFDKRKCDNYAK